MVINVIRTRNWLAVAQSNLDSLLGLGHWHVSALRNQRIELRNVTGRQYLSRERKENVGIVVASFIGNDRQHARVRANR